MFLVGLAIRAIPEAPTRMPLSVLGSFLDTFSILAIAADQMFNMVDPSAIHSSCQCCWRSASRDVAKLRHILHQR